MVVGAKWITVDPKVHVALRVQNSGVFIIGSMDTGDSDDWRWRVPTDPIWILA